MAPELGVLAQMASVQVVLQARMTSSRLPGKVLADVLGKPMILRQLERISLAKKIDRVTVAISDDISDDLLSEVLLGAGVDILRGDLKNVALRFYSVIRRDSPENVVRLTADCPLCDWDLIDRVITAHLESGADYTSNTLRRSYPKGLDVEVFTAKSFCKLIDAGMNPFEAEHVTPAYYSQDSKYALQSVAQERDQSDLRWTVDYPEDLDFVRYVYSALYSPGKPFAASLVRTLGRASSSEDDVSRSAELEGA